MGYRRRRLCTGKLTRNRRGLALARLALLRDVHIYSTVDRGLGAAVLLTLLYDAGQIIVWKPQASHPC